jgi:phage-related baseplate assembly protein
VFDFDPGDVVFLRPEAGASPAKTYRNTGVFHLGAGGTVTVDIQADEVGTASNAASGEISEFETPLIGVTCSNANAVIGIDEESDSELQAECREMADSLSPNGPRDAYSYFAKRAVRDDGSSVGVTRVKVSAPSQTAAVTITVATASGAVPGDVDDWETDLGLVDKTIQTNVTPDGITTTVRTGDLVTIAVTYEIWVYAWTGRTAAQIQSAVETALEAFIATQPIGGNLLPGQSVGYVYQDAIAAAIGAALPAGEIPHVVVTLPAADVELGDTDVPALGTVTCTEVHLVS